MMIMMIIKKKKIIRLPQQPTAHIYQYLMTRR